MTDILFPSVKNAIQWSEEVALSNNVQSSMKLWHSSGGKNLTGNEVADIANTVTMITASCKPFKGMAIKAVFSACSTDEDDRNVGIAIAANMMNMETAKGVHHESLISLGICAIYRKRSVELYDRRYPMGKVAKKLGVSRETIYKSQRWKTLWIEAEQRLLVMVMNAEIEIYSKLLERGWMM